MKNLRIIAISCLTMLTLAGCQPAMDLNPWESYPVPSCPKTQLLKDTDIITAYRSGLGRDITDIRYEAEINGFKGSCEYIGKKGEVSNIKLIKSSGYTILDNSGIDAAKKSRFYPLKKERTLNIEYNLRLNR